MRVKQKRKTMKKSVLLLALLVWSGITFAQLTGTKTIPGDYTSVAAAIAALNTQGVGAGGVTFNIAAGYTETLSSVTAGLINTTTGSATSPIVFQKSGAGANPLITAGTPGTGTMDNVFCVLGTDYITFDGINIQENPANTTTTTQMERGYAVLKASATNGSQFVTIKNCNISLAQSHTATYGIYSNNITNVSTTQLSIASSDGTNSNNKFYSNTFSNIYNGIYLYGFADGTAPYAFYDQNNEVGKDGGNTFTSLGGGSSTAYCFYSLYQNNLRLANNSFLGTVGTSASSGAFYCVYMSTMNNANLDVYNNIITVTYNGTGAFYGMYSLAGGSGTSNTTNIYNNQVTNCNIPNATSAAFYGMYMYGGLNSNFYNNSVTNNTYGSSTATATGSIYGIYHYCSPTGTGLANVYGNTVANNSRVQSAIGTGTGYHFYTSGGNGTMNMYNNTVNNQTIGSSSTQYIAYILYSGIKYFYNNTITNILNSNGGTLYSIYNGNGSGDAVFYNNQVRNINGNVAGSIVYGFYQSSGTNVYLYNNFFSELKAPAATGNPAIYGIYFSGGTNLGAYNNTIYLNATSTGATFGTTGIYASTTPSVELRNNIVVNNSTPMGTAGRVVAYQRSSSALANYLNTSNNNDFWAGTPGPNNLIYYDATNSLQTLPAYQGLVSPRDASSISENPPFVNVATVPYDLHLQTTVQTQCESGGAVVSSPVNILTDYDNNPRYPNPGYPDNPTSPASAPDIGADEFAGLKLDLTPPNIQFTPFANTSSTAPRTLTTIITDATGVPTSGAGLPRLYWRINSGSWNSTAATYVSGNQYTFTFGAGAVLNDVVSYYIVAQDLVTPIPNIGASPSGGATGFTANPPACSTPPTTPNSYIIVGQLCGSYNVGAGQTYATLTAAIADLNLKEITCPVTFVLTDATYSTAETFPLVINQPAGISQANQVTFKPAAGVNPTITGNSTTAILVFNGTGYVTFDGSNNGTTSRNMTIQNTATSGTTAVVWIGSIASGNGAHHITVKNCNIANGYNTSTSEGIFIGAASGIGTAGTDNNNITILNNAISKAYYGIYSLGTSTGLFNDLVIQNNTIGSANSADYIGYYGIYLAGANAPLVKGNEIFNLISGAMTYQTAIELNNNLADPVIWGNHIHDLQNNNTGGWGAYGINVASSSVTGAMIVNNVIYNVNTINYSTSSTTYNPFGIRLTAGANHKIYHNTVHLTGTQFNSGTTGTLSACLLVTSSSVTGLDIRDNIFTNNLEGMTGSISCAIYIPSGTVLSNINYNDYYGYGTYGILGYFGSNITSLAAWQTATGQDANSLSVDPGYVSATDYHPTNNALNNTGTYLTQVPTDFTGAMRTNPPDFGAYNFGNDPVVNTTAATAITGSTATLNGTINAATLTVNSFFDYGTTTAYGTSLPGVPSSVSGSSTTPISLGISSLAPLTTYHYRARGVTAGGLIVYGPDMTFTTAAIPPTAVTTAATGIVSTGATLNGTMNANGASTAVTFQYGLTTSYGSTAPGVPATVTGSTVTPASAVIAGLLPNTLYHFRIVGVNSGGTTNGNDMTFTTGPGSPVVVTELPSNITLTGAQLNGTVTANSPTATVSFQWGLTTAYGNTTPAIPATVSGNSPTAVLATLTGLVQNTTYHYRCVAVNPTGTVYGLDQSFLTGCPAPAPAGPIGGPAAVCQNGTGYVYSVGPITNATSYQWTLPTGGTITAGAGTNTITVSYSAVAVSGNVTVAGVGVCGPGTPSSLAVTVNPMPTPAIAGPASACANSTGNNYTTSAGLATYAWTVSAGGTIASGQGTNSINVTWTTTGAQSVGLTATNSFGCTGAAAAYPVTVNARPAPTITGPTAMCASTSGHVYTTQAGMTGYVWTVSAGGTITAGAGTNAITVSWSTSGAKTVSVNYANAAGCTAVTPASLNVTVNPLPVPTIGSGNNPCVGSTGNMYYTEAGMTNYVWTISTGGTIVSGQGSNAINVTWNAVGAQTVGVSYTNTFNCNPTTPTVLQVFVSPMPNAAGTITGTGAVCAGASGVAYSCAPVGNAISYTWTLPAGAVIASGAGTNNITVNFGAAATSGNITVAGTNGCGNGTPSPAFPVTVNPLPAAAGTITGPASVCAGQTNVAYSVPVIANAVTYSWTVPAGATIVSGGTTRNIVVNFDANPGSGVITVKGINTCGEGAVSPNFNVTINAIPATPVVTANGPVLTSSASTGNQWYYEGTAIPGATGQSYTVTHNTGYYWCVVTVNGCSSEISNKVWIEITGIGEITTGSFNVYPVPNDGKFTVTVTSPQPEKISLQVFNQTGEKIFELSDLTVNGTFGKTIDMRPAATGIYSVVLLKGDVKTVRRIMVNRQ